MLSFILDMKFWVLFFMLKPFSYGIGYLKVHFSYERPETGEERVGSWDEGSPRRHRALYNLALSLNVARALGTGTLGSLRWRTFFVSLCVWNRSASIYNRVQWKKTHRSPSFARSKKTCYSTSFVLHVAVRSSAFFFTHKRVIKALHDVGVMS